MATPFLGQVSIFAGNFAPRGWADCSGQLLAISQNDALFSLLGTAFGGDGITTFGLPDLRGRAPMGQGQGPGLTARTLGEVLGTESVTLTSTQIPAHTHGVIAYDTPATHSDPAGRALAKPGLANPSAPQEGNSLFYLNPAIGSPNTAAQPADTIAASGGNQPHENIQPFLVIRYIIALEGVYPSRN